VYSIEIKKRRQKKANQLINTTTWLQAKDSIGTGYDSTYLSESASLSPRLVEQIIFHCFELECLVIV